MDEILLTKVEYLRLAALDLAVQSKERYGGTTSSFLDRALEFEDYIKNGAQDGKE